MPRRLLLTTDVVGGVWDFTLALAREVHADVTVLALGEPSAAQAHQANEAGVRLIAEPLKLEWMRDSAADVERTRLLVARLVDELRPTVLHANQFVAACADVGVPVVLTLHSDVLTWRRWTLGQEETPPADWLPYRRLVGDALARATSVVAVSGFLAEAIHEAYGWAGEIQVIHNGWPHEAIRPAGQRPAVTVVAGRVWDAAKNLALVGRAAAGWDAGMVYLAGEQTNPDSGAKMPIPPGLRSVGFLSRGKLDELLGSARIYLSAARYDPFGLLPLQAAIGGCCLLLSDIPSYRELWEGAAAFFRSDDVADLRTQWARLIAAPAQAMELSRRAQQRAIEQYSVGRMAAAYADLYGAVEGALAV